MARTRKLECAVLCGLCTTLEIFDFAAQGCTQLHAGAQRCTMGLDLCGGVRLESKKHKGREGTQRLELPDRLKAGTPNDALHVRIVRTGGVYTRFSGARGTKGKTGKCFSFWFL